MSECREQISDFPTLVSECEAVRKTGSHLQPAAEAAVPLKK
jgi:hypothetical protein